MSCTLFVDSDRVLRRSDMVSEWCENSEKRKSSDLSESQKIWLVLEMIKEGKSSLFMAIIAE